MFKHWNRTLVLLGAALAAGQLGIGLCTAGKPGAPPDPPGPGAICLRESFVTADRINAQDVWEMNSDGSNRLLAYTKYSTEVDEPSYLTYGGYRWWLTVVDDMVNGADVYAIRSNGANGLIWVQLTDVARDGIDLIGDLTRARWSWDDEFITVVGADRRQTTVTYHVWRIDISGLEIELHQSLTPVTSGDERFCAMVNSSESINGGYALSPSGDKLVYQTTSGVWVTNVVDPYARTFLRSDGMRFDWSPDGTKITFTVKPSVWTMNPDGTGAKAVAVGKNVSGTMHGSPGYLHSFWSPDSKWLVFRRDVQVRVGGSRPIQCDIVQMPAGGGTIINLTGDMDPFTWKLPFAWRPVESAY